MDTIRLDKLQEIINKLYDDVTNDIKTLKESELKNQGALLGLSTLINRINGEISGPATESETFDAEVIPSSHPEPSGETGVPV